MAGVLDSGWLRVAGYGVVAAACVAAGLVERRRPRRAALWPAFWFATAAVLALMGLARAGDVGDLIADVGRDQARERGWYDIRREYQAWAVGAVGAVWAVVVLVAVWRVPERRRRYLPAALVVVTLGCFAAVRMISLHQVDTVLYRRDLGGVRVAAVVELGLLAVMLLAIVAPVAGGAGRRDAAPARDRATVAE